MEFDFNTTIEQMRQLNFVGNIIPHAWYSKITFDNGKPDLLGTVLLAEIVYWYRPVEIKEERTGKLLGYRKKFSADMLQRSISSFAVQFGLSKRQVSDALKRLEDAGLIIREMRIIETSQGTIGNVQYLAPIVTAIKALDSDPADNKLITSDESQEELASASDDNTLCDEVPPHTFERSRGYVQTYEGVRSNAVPTTFERGTYTKNTAKNTTKITTENTAARDQNRLHKSVSTDNTNSKPVAAASFSKKSNSASDAHMQRSVADTLIGESLTVHQTECVEKTARAFGASLNVDATQLTQEIEHVILSSTSFTNANRNFAKKLNTIKKVIKEQGWNTPVGMTEQKADEHQKKIEPIKRELTEAELDCAHWIKMVEWAREMKKDKKLQDFQSLLMEAQKKLAAIKQKCFEVVKDISQKDLIDCKA